MNLKPETPLIKKLEIKRLEDECEKFKTVALEINYCDRADTDHGIRSVCGQLFAIR